MSGVEDIITAFKGLSEEERREALIEVLEFFDDAEVLRIYKELFDSENPPAAEYLTTLIA